MSFQEEDNIDALYASYKNTRDGGTLTKLLNLLPQEAERIYNRLERRDPRNTGKKEDVVLQVVANVGTRLTPPPLTIINILNFCDSFRWPKEYRKRSIV